MKYLGVLYTIKKERGGEPMDWMDLLLTLSHCPDRMSALVLHGASEEIWKAARNVFEEGNERDKRTKG